MLYGDDDSVLESSMKIVCIGDPHGSLNELQELLANLESAGHLDNDSRLIILGDAVDRGVDSVGCLRFVKSLCLQGKAEVLKGNHEDKHVRYRSRELRERSGGKKNSMRRMNERDYAAHIQFTNEEIAWMDNLPLKIRIRDDWYAIHGGLESRFDFDHQNPDQILRCRYLNKDGKAVALNEDKSAPADSVYWAEVWPGKQSIVYGHCVHSLSKPRIDERPNNVKCIGIDTGCCFGGRLTAAILEWDKEPEPAISFVQVQAKQNYAPTTSWKFVRYEE